MDHNKKTYIALIQLLVILVLLYYSGKNNVIYSQNISVSYEHVDDWNQLHLDDSDWRKIGKTFLSYSAPRDVYLRQFFETNSDSIVLHMIADDCIEEIYLNGKLIFDGDCISCSHCVGKDFTLYPIRDGENLLAVKILNTGGPSMLKVREIKKGLPFILILLSILTFAHLLLHIKKLSKHQILRVTLLFACFILYLSSVIGFVDFYSASAAIILSCIVFLFLIKENLLDSNLTIMIFFLVLASGFLLPTFKNIDYWGRGDWDAFYSLTYVPLKSLLEYGQLPMWNPYMCGGMTFVGDPESGFYSPQLIPILLFGLTAGIRVNILLHLVLSLFGMWLLGKHFGLNGYSRLFPALVYSLSSIYFKHMWEGHYTYIAMAWIPYVFYFYLEGLKDSKKLILSGFFSALILFNGNINYLGYSFLLLGVYSLIETIKGKEKFKGASDVKNKLRPIYSVIIVLIVFILISSIKLLPLIERSSHAPREISDKAFISLTYQDLFDLMTNSDIGPKWHESSAYIGLLAFAIIVLGLILRWRSNINLLLCCLFFVFIFLNKNSPIYIWGYINSNLPLYNSIRVVTRVVALITLTSSLFGGLALRALGFISKKFVKLLVIIVLLNLFLITPFSLDEWFTVEPHTLNPNEYNVSEFQQIRYSFEDVPHASSDMYRLILVNKGITNCWSPVAPSSRALPSDSFYYVGEVFTARNKGTVSINEFTSNGVKVDVNLISSDIVVLNQNYYPGWHSSAGPVESHNGLISVKVDSDVSELEFYYSPYSFILGLLVTLVSTPLLLLVAFSRSFREFTYKKIKNILKYVK